MMLTLLIIFYIEQLQSENASERMLLVEAEFFTLLGFRTVSGDCSGTHASSKGREAAGLWAVVRGAVCVRTRAPACVHNRGTPFRKTQTTELLGQQNTLQDGRQNSKHRSDGTFPGCLVVKNPPSKAEDMGSIPGLGTKIPHAMGQLSTRATTREPSTAVTESRCSSVHSLQQERPLCSNWRWLSASKKTTTK